MWNEITIQEILHQETKEIFQLFHFQRLLPNMFFPTSPKKNMLFLKMHVYITCNIIMILLAKFYYFSAFRSEANLERWLNKQKKPLSLNHTRSGVCDSRSMDNFVDKYIRDISYGNKSFKDIFLIWYTKNSSFIS